MKSVRPIFLLLSISVSMACSSISKSPQASYTGHGAESVSPEDLKRFAAPPLEPKLSTKIQNLLDLKSHGPGFLVEKSAKYFFNWSITGANQVWMIDGPGRFPIQMTAGEQPTELAGITPDGRYLILSRDNSGDEYTGLFLQSTKGGPINSIFQLPKVAASLEWLSSDSQSFYFRANHPDSKSFHIYRYDIEKRQHEPILSEPGFWRISDGKKDSLLLRKAITATSSEVYELNLITKKLSPVIGQGEEQDYAIRYGAREGDKIVLTSKGQDFRGLFLLKEGNLSPLTPNLNWDIEDFQLDRAKKRIIFTVNEGGYTKLKGLDAKTFAPIKVPQFPGAEQVDIEQLTLDGERALFSVNRFDSPRQYFMHQWVDSKSVRLLTPSTPEVLPEYFSKASLEFYPARDGTQIPVFVRRPKQCVKEIPREKPCPVVISFHGGPEDQSQPGYSIRANMFVDEGFVFAEPNVRGSTGYGKKWLDADNGPKRLAVITDIEDAALHFKKSEAVGGKSPKIGITGGSYGGYATLYGMTKYAASFDAGVASVGMSNLITFLNNTAPYRRALRIPEYGDPEKDKDALIELSPVTHLKNVRAPLLIIQGISDPRVPAGEAIQFQRALASRSLDSQLILMADEGHGPTKRSSQALHLGHSLLFFKKHLQ